MIPVRSLLAPALVATLAGTNIFIGAAPPSPAPDLGTAAVVERATVELVLIEAYVTDARGRPLRDLTTQDFRLMVDGYQKPIYSLEFREVEVPTAGPMTAAAPIVVTETPGGTPRRLPRRFILFFEDSTSLPENLAAARRAANRFLESGLLPGDEVAVASYDRKLRILHDFTTDRTMLRQAIEASLQDPRRFTDYASDQAGYERNLADLLARSRAPGATMNPGQIRLTAKNYASEYTPRFRAVLRALSSLVDSLASYPGYKGIVFMGDGVAENPAVDLLQQFVASVPASLTSEFERYNLSMDIKKLAHEASAAGVTLHSVQTSGLSSTSASEMRAGGRRSNALDTLALNTGGTKSSSNDFFKALTQAENASRAYYVIGYAPEGPPDGQYHTVQLRLKHRSGSMTWRRGFTRLLPEQTRERTVEAAYLLPELYPDLGVEISMAPGPVDGQAQIYDLVIHVPPGRALFVPQPGGVMARLDAGFVMIDGSQREVLRTARQAVITMQGTGAGLGFDFYSRIRVPRGGQTITAVVYDRAANVLGAARHELPAAEPATSEALGLALYSLSENSLWVEIPATGAPPPAETAVSYEVGPALKTTFAVGEPVTCGFRFNAAPAPESLRLVIRDGPKELRGIDVLPRASGDETPPPEGSFKVKLPVEGLPAGNYLLVVRRRVTGGAELDAGTAPLRLRSTGAPGA